MYKESLTLTLNYTHRLHRVRANKGYYVSTSGYQSGAVELAKQDGIALLHIPEHDLRRVKLLETGLKVKPEYYTLKKAPESITTHYYRQRHYQSQRENLEYIGFLFNDKNDFADLLGPEVLGTSPRQILKSLFGMVANDLIVSEFNYKTVDEGGATFNGAPLVIDFYKNKQVIRLQILQTIVKVEYIIGEYLLTHKQYMLGLGNWDDCDYKGQATDPMDSFEELGYDFRHLADDFIKDSGKTFIVIAQNMASSNPS